MIAEGNRPDHERPVTTAPTGGGVMASEEEWGRRVLAANAEGMRWTCEQAGHPNQLPDDVTCICGTWAHHIEAGAVVVGCGGRPGNEPGSYVREASDG